MAIAPTMNSRTDGNEAEDGHEHDVVMPGFRFHPTEEELIEFYLRRKVEGKRFNVELITFLDLYRYDPWELPALAAIGEKEWFFYVPRDRKYRNGDRPNRVTTSGYWKATGADRMIRSESSRSIGLKKTLVFYMGKAPRGTRTSWIMNEYRLPQNETARSQKAEISLCRVYKRPGIPNNHHQLSSSHLQSRPFSSRPPLPPEKKNIPNPHRASAIFPGLVGEPSSDIMDHAPTYAEGASAMPIDSVRSEGHPEMDSFMPSCTLLSFTASSSMPAATVDELNRLMGLHHHGGHLLHAPQGSTQPLQQQLLSLPTLPNPLGPLSPDKFWEWNTTP